MDRIEYNNAKQNKDPKQTICCFLSYVESKKHRQVEWGLFGKKGISGRDGGRQVWVMDTWINQISLYMCSKFLQCTSLFCTINMCL
jgi:hypothetical protein